MGWLQQQRLPPAKLQQDMDCHIQPLLPHRLLWGNLFVGGCNGTPRRPVLEADADAILSRYDTLDRSDDFDWNSLRPDRADCQTAKSRPRAAFLLVT